MTSIAKRVAVRVAAVRFVAQDTPERHKALVDLAMDLGDPVEEQESKKEHDRMERGGHTRAEAASAEA